MSAALTRLPDWQLRFAAFAQQRRDLPFKWGENDCALFAADAVLALTGKDPAAEMRGYASALQAARAARKYGGLAAAADAMLGLRVSPLMAGVGDIVLLDMGNHEALGVCNGSSLIGPGPNGIVAYGMGCAKAAWRI